jgi:hypothetical protein
MERIDAKEAFTHWRGKGCPMMGSMEHGPGMMHGAPPEQERPE